ncbi:MAG: hypothetical protein P8M22_03140 [Phycisphaerales bacterium]|nr:hypothetical protein [Phycisphaerales bacterium]
MGTESDRNMINRQLHHEEAICSKKRVREQLHRMIVEAAAEPDYCTESEWTDMSPSGEFETILA